MDMDICSLDFTVVIKEHLSWSFNCLHNMLGMVNSHNISETLKSTCENAGTSYPFYFTNRMIMIETNNSLYNM